MKHLLPLIFVVTLLGACTDSQKTIPSAQSNAQDNTSDSAENSTQNSAQNAAQDSSGSSLGDSSGNSSQNSSQGASQGASQNNPASPNSTPTNQPDTGDTGTLTDTTEPAPDNSTSQASDSASDSTTDNSEDGSTVVTTANPANTTAPSSNNGGLNIMTGQPIPSSLRAPLQPVFPFAGIPENAAPLPAVISTPEGLDATFNKAPYFEGLEDQIVYAGQYMELRLVPRDPDGNIPGLFTGALPEGSEYIDNFDGTKTIRWRALEPDVGTFEITVTAVDAEAPLYRTSRTIRVRVRLPSDLSTIVNLPPSINNVNPHIARVGDLVTILVKAEDPNGYIPKLEIINPQPGMSFEQLPEDDNIKVLRWRTDNAALGEHNLLFRAIDAKNPTLTIERSITITLLDTSTFTLPGTALRDLAAARNFYVGYASLQAYYYRPDGQLYSDIATNEFNIMTTENSLKWGSVNPEPNEWKWQAFDTEMQLAWQHSMVVHGHTLLWHRQLPQWVQNLPLAKREQVMLDYIAHVVGRYGDNVGVWDVVNEAFEDDGSYRNSVWYQAMGSGFIEKAFRQAKIGAPNSQLVYNDYDVAWESPKTDAMYEMVRELLNNGVPIDGVGFQMHLKSDFDQSESVRRNFQRFANLGLDIYITELDVALTGYDSFEKQATVYEEVMDICLTQPACRALQIWGFTDRYSWRKDSRPLIFNDAYHPKPSYFALQNRLTSD